MVEPRTFLVKAPVRMVRREFQVLKLVSERYKRN
jgi:hypothetical protein